ncbi:MAG: bifunctional 5,10-methylenetetrahydrofolate dehydrogenase/5,10-methenyltetrahydrofolate cyclohydrolase [Candidatus Yanofskybacteria bacterium]|nr:bifunctional 5,10-methylenetetrahydrofolate dehydrogenase/5,10-methenyltetrahydrofolate cyclohydrolase [Candidatus Yanofskybacteria bacterium]
MAAILSGTELAERILRSLSKEAQDSLGGLAVVLVGEHRTSLSYVREKEKIAERLSTPFRVFRFPEDVSQTELESRVREVGLDSQYAGVLVQLPLPKDLHTQRILDCIPLEKDVDVLSSLAFGKFALGTSPILPPTVAAVSELLIQTKIQLKGTPVLVVGAGRLVGLPLSFWLTRQGATVTVAHKHTLDLRKAARDADVIISGVGKAKLITGDMVKRGAVVIDAGTSVEEGKSAGDVDFESVSKKAAWVTPVPGGVGPLTVACLMRNLFSLRTFERK